MWTTLSESSRRYSLKLADMRFEVDANVGGRIVTFSHAGRNVLEPLEDLGDWTNGGSTFWTSPQADWGWPPVPALDRGRYEVALDETEHSLSLTSPAFVVGGSRLSVEKRYVPDPERRAIAIEYSITNHGPPLSLAGWEITRVAPRGLSFFEGAGVRPLGGKPKPHLVDDGSGIVWMQHAGQEAESKLGANASGGFVAYANESLLFLKTFDKLPAGAAAPEEDDLELYVKPGCYVEIEQQSAARLVTTGEQLGYRVHWHLVPLPAGLEVTPGSEPLVALARQLGRSSRGPA